MEFLQIAKEWASPAILATFLGWVGVEVWSGYKKHRTDVYGKLEKKVEKTDCREWRDAEEKVMEAHRKEAHRDR